MITDPMLRGCTHFAPGYSRNTVIAFHYEKCPKCGAKIYNSAESTPNLGPCRGTSFATFKETLKKMGLKEVDQLPPDLQVDFHDDDYDLAEEWFCEDCA